MHSFRPLMLELFESILDASWHRAFEGAVLVIPFECDAVMLFGIPVDREFVDFG